MNEPLLEYDCDIFEESPVGQAAVPVPVAEPVATASAAGQGLARVLERVQLRAIVNVPTRQTEKAALWEVVPQGDVVIQSFANPPHNSVDMPSAEESFVEEVAVIGITSIDDLDAPQNELPACSDIASPEEIAITGIPPGIGICDVAAVSAIAVEDMRGENLRPDAVEIAALELHSVNEAALPFDREIELPQRMHELDTGSSISDLQSDIEVASFESPAVEVIEGVETVEISTEPVLPPVLLWLNSRPEASVQPPPEMLIVDTGIPEPINWPSEEAAQTATELRPVIRFIATMAALFLLAFGSAWVLIHLDGRPIHLTKMNPLLPGREPTVLESWAVSSAGTTYHWRQTSRPEATIQQEALRRRAARLETAMLASALANEGSEPARQILITELLHRPSGMDRFIDLVLKPGTRQAALQSLQQMKTAPVARLLAQLNQPQAIRRLAAARAAAAVCDDDTLLLLKRRIQKGENRREALAVLAWSDRPESAALLRRLVHQSAIQAQLIAVSDEMRQLF